MYLRRQLFCEHYSELESDYFFMQKDLDDNSYEKRIENIEKGKSYLKSNGFFRSKSNLFEDIQRFIYKK